MCRRRGVHRGDERLARRGIAVTDDEIGLTGGEDENLVRLAVAFNAGEGVGLDAVEVAEHGDAPPVEVEDGAIALGEEEPTSTRCGGRLVIVTLPPMSVWPGIADGTRARSGGVPVC